MVSTPTPCLRSATTITPSGKYHLGHVLSFRSPIPIFFARDWHFYNGRTFEWFARHGPPEREKVLEVIDGVYVAGSYTEFILHEYKQLLRIRSLLARGRATMAPSTPDVIARLFGGTAAASRRPRTRRSQLSLTRSTGVPDPIFWKVMEYWRLGDWRHP